MVRLVSALFLSLALAAVAHAHTYTVPANHAGLIRLPADASGLAIGNPSIADITLYDARTILVTGKTYGRTNIIAMNSEGRVIYTTDLAVTENDRGLVQVYHNTERGSFVCNPVCQAIPLVGDGEEHFGRIDGQTGTDG